MARPCGPGYGNRADRTAGRLHRTENRHVIRGRRRDRGWAGSAEYAPVARNGSPAVSEFRVGRPVGYGAHDLVFFVNGSPWP